MHRTGISGVLWLLSLWLPYGCASTTSEEEASQPSAAGSIGLPPAKPCPALPLSELCGPDGNRVDAERNPLGTCPQTFGAARDMACNKWGIPGVDGNQNSCGGLTITVWGPRPNYTEYHFGADHTLIGVLWHKADARGCAASQLFGMSCTFVPLGDIPACPFPAGG